MFQRPTKGPISEATSAKHKRKIDPYALSIDKYTRENAWKGLMYASDMD